MSAFFAGSPAGLRTATRPVLRCILAAPVVVHRQEQSMSEQSDRMMVLLQELQATKKADENGEKSPITKKRRREISREMKQLALQKKNTQE